MTWELPEGAATAVCPSVPRIGALTTTNLSSHCPGIDSQHCPVTLTACLCTEGGSQYYAYTTGSTGFFLFFFFCFVVDIGDPLFLRSSLYNIQWAPGKGSNIQMQISVHHNAMSSNKQT